MRYKKTSYQILNWIPYFFMIILVILMTIFRFPKELEKLAEDILYQKADSIPEEIKIIAIDEKTLDFLGPYSEWDRTYFCNLIQRLTEEPDETPKVIGMDIIFTGRGDSDGDRKLTEAVESAGNVILASKLETDSGMVPSQGKSQYVLRHYIKGEITAFDELYRVSDSGFTNAIFDDDGYIRRAYTYIKTDQEIYKSFAFQIAEKVMDHPEILYDNPSVIEIPYTGNPGDFETISMSDVLNGTVPTDYFADSIVLIGAYEEGMLDSYHVPITHSKNMYGVECQANIICALMNQKRIYTMPIWVEAAIAALVTAGFGLIMRRCRIRNCLVALCGLILIYSLGILTLFRLSGYKLSVLYIPLGAILGFLASLLIRYIELQRKRTEEMQRMLFSMADSMAEAIEGRTPYNASHTKNVAKRCIEMMDYINQMYKEKRTKLHFSGQDKNQMYLAAMLHDIGKMDIPLEIMDKPTRLGKSEETLRTRLKMIMLEIENDSLSGKVDAIEAKQNISFIKQFLEKLDGFNSGRPLRDEELDFIDQIGSLTYQGDDGEQISYLTKEELDNLHIKAGTLSDKERRIMQSHVIYTDKILNHMYFGPEYKDVRAIAANHHELLNKKGYPKGLGAEQLDIMTRILTIMDIYDSLIADDRPYKKPKTKEVAFSILDEEAVAGKIDKEILAIAKEIWLDNNG